MAAYLWHGAGSPLAGQLKKLHPRISVNLMTARSDEGPPVRHPNSTPTLLKSRSANFYC